MSDLNKRTRLSSLKLDDSTSVTTGDDNDDTNSVGGASSTTEVSMRSDTPTSRKKAMRKQDRQKLQFKCTAYLKEDHESPIFGCQFNWYTKPGDPLVFATVGTNRVTIYKCLSNGKIKVLQGYTDADPAENFYTCAWSFDDETGLPILAAAGAKGIIRLIYPQSLSHNKYLAGHGQSVNELTFHPKDPTLLLSVSKDHSLRLWNIKTEVCIAIFGGVDGHRDEVLSADFCLEGKTIVSCGMDHSLKIWNLDKPDIKSAFEASRTYQLKKAARAFDTARQHYPEFSTRSIHRNYVDCVKWLGKFILSKSCQNCIACWKPGTLDSCDYKLKPTDSTVSIIYEFEVKDCPIWFIRFSIDHEQKVLALGNQTGKVFVWDLLADDFSQAKCTVLSHKRCVSTIRQNHFSRDGNTLICVCDDATIWRWDRVH